MGTGHTSVICPVGTHYHGTPQSLIQSFKYSSNQNLFQISFTLLHSFTLVLIHPLVLLNSFVLFCFFTLVLFHSCVHALVPLSPKCKVKKTGLITVCGVKVSPSPEGKKLEQVPLMQKGLKWPCHLCIHRRGSNIHHKAKTNQ